MLSLPHADTGTLTRGRRYGLFSPPVSLAPDVDSKFRVPDKCKGKQVMRSAAWLGGVQLQPMLFAVRRWKRAHESEPGYLLRW